MCVYIHIHIYTHALYILRLGQGLPWWLSWSRICLQCGRPQFNPWLGRSPGEGNGYPLQYSGLENSMDYPWGSRVGHN